MNARVSSAVAAILDAALRGELTETQAQQLYAYGPEAVTLVLLTITRHVAEQDAGIATREAADAGPSPSTPSGMVPVYAKPNATRRRRRPGARKGHPGTRRVQPTRIDRQEVHRLPRCPHCNGRLQRCQRVRSRLVEDIPQDIQPVITEHLIHRDFCPRCKKHVEPVVPDALPRATLGHHVVALSSWFHYGLGITIDQIVEILSCHLRTRLTPGGLIQAWRHLAEVLTTWYEEIGRQAREAAHLHADETGWRVNGQTYWLWCFATAHVCYYMIDRCRGSPALKKFFTDAFAGVLITDFWAAYEAVCAEDRQYCLVHLLRELETVDLRNDSFEWKAFARRLRRLLRAAIRLRQRADFAPGKYQSRVDRLNRRLARMAAAEPVDVDTRRLTKRLRRYAEYLLTFLDYADVPYENNFAERQIRPAVIIRKNSLSNRSERGASMQAVLMSVYRTLKLRGLNPTRTIAAALRTYVATGKLPPLPDPAIAHG